MKTISVRTSPMRITSNRLINNLISSFILLSIIFILMILIYNTNVQKILKNSIYDAIFRATLFLYNKKINKDNIVIVPIDENSLNILKDKNYYWPWPRDNYAYISRYLIEEGAKAVVFDIIFTNQDINRANQDGTEILYGIDNDLAFAEAMKDTEKIILSFDIGNQELDKKNVFETREIKNASIFKNVKVYKNILYPYTLFTENNENFGFVEIEADYDGIIREYSPFVKINDKYYPSLAAATYLLVNSENLPENLMLNKKGNFKIFWYGRGGRDETFAYYPIVPIISDYINKRLGRTQEIPRGAFKDKIVFIGATARGLLDMKNTPFSSQNAYAGVEIHATAYLNLVNRDWVKTIPLFIEFLIYIIILYLLISFGLDAKKPLLYSALFVGILLIILMMHFTLFILFHYVLETALVIITFFLTYLFIQVINYITVGYNRNKIKNAFSTYISPDLLYKVTNSDKPLAAIMDKIDATALFIDIAGFTTFSEKNPVEKVVEILNLYLKKFSEAIIDNHGWVNKYLGDGLLALFGAPISYENHAEMAVKSAYQCYRINKELSADYGLNVRIGVNSGKMIFGSFGGGKKLEFTAIGDCLNLTSRLEGANKFFATNILIGELTKDELQNDYDLRYLGKFSLKGKDIPSKIYYYNDLEEEYKDKFDLMIMSYEKKDIDTFMKISDFFKDKNFGPAGFYINFYKGHKDKFGEPIKLTEK